MELNKGETIMINASLHLPAAFLHEAFSNRSGVPPDHFELYYRGKRLEGEATLASYGIGKDSTIEVKMRGRGGMLPGAIGRGGSPDGRRRGHRSPRSQANAAEEARVEEAGVVEEARVAEVTVAEAAAENRGGVSNQEGKRPQKPKGKPLSAATNAPAAVLAPAPAAVPVPEVEGPAAIVPEAASLAAEAQQAAPLAAANASAVVPVPAPTAVPAPEAVDPAVEVQSAAEAAAAAASVAAADAVKAAAQLAFQARKSFSELSTQRLLSSKGHNTFPSAPCIASLITYHISRRISSALSMRSDSSISNLTARQVRQSRPGASGASMLARRPQVG